MTRGVGSQKLIAPEINNDEEKYNDEKADVYSFGAVAFFIIDSDFNIITYNKKSFKVNFLIDFFK